MKTFPARLKTDRVIKSAAATNVGAINAAANDPHLMYRVASPTPSDVSAVAALLQVIDQSLFLTVRAATISRQRYLHVAWLALHLLLIVSFSCRETLRVIAEGPTILPLWFKNFSQKAQTVFSIALGQKLAASNPVRETLNTYVNAAGIETGYGYFAPNVPGGYRLVFELHYPDGRVEYELPAVRSEAAGLRVAGLLENIGRTPYDAMREILVKTLAQSVWHAAPGC